MNPQKYVQNSKSRAMNGNQTTPGGNAALAHLEVLDLLVDYILDSDEESAIKLIEGLYVHAIKALERYRLGDRGDEDHMDDGDVTVLQLASAYSMSTELISLMATKCPAMLTVQRNFPYEGQMVVHTLVSTENIRTLVAILNLQSPPDQVRLLRMSTVTDNKAPVNATVMLGGLLLSIAALTFNLEMMDLLLQHGADLSDKNDCGDTVFHSRAGPVHRHLP